MPNKPNNKTIAEAKGIVAGVRAIAKNEQLERGAYLSARVDQRLQEAGAICGGYKACLLGSIAIADGAPHNINIITYYADRLGTGLDVWGPAGGSRPSKAAVLVHTVFSDIAKKRIEHAARYGPKRRTAQKMLAGERDFESWAESYFEKYLERASRADIHYAVLSLCTAAQRKLTALSA